MEKPHSKLTAQGQISVPAEVRRKLGLAPGSVLEWREQEGEYVVRRVARHTSVNIHKALFEKAPKPISLADLKRAIKRHAKRKHARD